MARVTYAIEEVKAGHIRPYHGLIANIPAGWVLCNGSNGTPDLREVFPKGAPAGQEAGATGGSATHTHAGHSSHVFTQPTSHPATATAQADVGATKAGTATSTVTLLTHKHNTPVLGHSGGGVDAHSAHDTPNSEPPYRTVLWIMKL